MNRVRLALADGGEREAIYRMRHAVYAAELGQHALTAEERLSDPLDGYNEYVVAAENGDIAGFVSLTPPGRGRYSVDKYFSREEIPFPFDDGLWEVRLLTVPPRSRGRALAFLLMYAAFRLAEWRSRRKRSTAGWWRRWRWRGGRRRTSDAIYQCVLSSAVTSSPPSDPRLTSQITNRSRSERCRASGVSRGSSENSTSVISGPVVLGSRFDLDVHVRGSVLWG